MTTVNIGAGTILGPLQNVNGLIRGGFGEVSEKQQETSRRGVKEQRQGNTSLLDVFPRRISSTYFLEVPNGRRSPSPASRPNASRARPRRLTGTPLRTRSRRRRSTA